MDNDDGITLVYFYESDCDSCREQLPIAEELAQDLRYIARIVNVNLQQEKEISDKILMSCPV
ncbi:thioredoxin family protein [Paenibacillus sp. UNC496MF]|uniref:conjugal transfer protein TraF n=1 Tax=Paenibacillus sp. UNC496MF TaxID=1502753 RepID=UPI000B89E018